MTRFNSGDNKWRFVGIWSKNRWEWLATHLANQYFSHTTIGFFDSMGPETVDYILGQTELTSVFVAKEYVQKLLDMRAKNLGAKIKNIVSFDQVDDSLKAEWDKKGVKVYTLAEVIEKGKNSNLELRPQNENDSPLFSYTSGTTGDSKGVKLTHKNLLTTCASIIHIFDLNTEDSIISYLPYPHSFE